MIQQPALGKKIVEYRKAKGFTQEQLVEKCNLNVRTLQRIEAGEVTPRISTIKLIFEALEIEFENAVEATTEENGTFDKASNNFLELFNFKNNSMKKIFILLIPVLSIVLMLIVMATRGRTFDDSKVNRSSITEASSYFIRYYNSGQIEFSTSFGVNQKYDDLIKVLEGKYVNHVLQLSDTRLAISTQTSGLFLYDLQKKTIERITNNDGLQSNACLRAFQDYSGNLWVGMQNGLAIIDINSPMRFINRDIDIEGSGYESFEVDLGTYYTTSNGIYFLAKDAGESVF